MTEAMQTFSSIDTNERDRTAGIEAGTAIETTMKRLFVYGTLAPGQANHEVLADIPGDWQPATLRGRLHDEGWGAEFGCPGIVPARDGDDVPGHLLTSAQLDRHWQRLDDYEGDGYRRVEVSVLTGSGEQVDAYVYALDRDD